MDMIYPDTKLEEKLWQEGKKNIAGVDEAGRGPLAGPVVVGAVLIRSPKEVVEGVRDSKTMSRKQREKACKEIKRVSTSYGIGTVSAREIDRIGIKRAVQKAMRSAISQLEKRLGEKVDYVIADGGVYLLKEYEMISINDGDLHHYSISAGSILAKVARDILMEEYAKEFPVYGFERNMGYGTKEHIECITKYGACYIHRKSFAPVKKVL